MNELIVGDTWEFEYVIRDNQGQAIDLSTYAIRAAIIDNTGKNIKIANAKVGGGSITQITNDSNGKINLIFSMAKTSLIKSGHAQLEIEITSLEGKRYTVVQDSYNVKAGLINWDTIT